MSWKVLRPQIASLLETIDKIQEVSSTPKVDFSGYPSAHVMPSDNEGDYQTTKENTRTYAFKVRLFDETKNQGVAQAMANLEEVVDEVIDAIDEDDLKASETRVIGVDLDSNKYFLNIWATPSQWGELTEEQLIVAELTVRIRLSIDVT